MIKVVIADDHPTILDGLCSYFENDPHIGVVGTTTKSGEVIGLIRQTGADILLLDYSFGDQKPDGIDLIKSIQEQNLPTQVIIITGYTELRLVHRFIELGARGYLFKSSKKEEYLDAVKNVYLGGEVFGAKVKEVLLEEKLDKKHEIAFTRAELDIIKLISRGLTTKEISKQLNRTKNTIDSHRKNILSKLQVMDGGNDNSPANISYYIAKFKLIEKYNLFG